MKYILRFANWLQVQLTIFYVWFRSLTNKVILKKVTKNHLSIVSDDERVSGFKTQRILNEYVLTIIEDMRSFSTDDIANFYKYGEGKKLVERTNRGDRVHNTVINTTGFGGRHTGKDIWSTEMEVDLYEVDLYEVDLYEKERGLK